MAIPAVWSAHSSRKVREGERRQKCRKSRERQGLSAQTPMRLRRATDNENARSALECGREAAAFPWTIQSETNCGVPIYRDDGGRRPPLQPDAQTFMSLCIDLSSQYAGGRWYHCIPLRSLPQPHSKAVAAATALQGAFGTVIFMTASGEAACRSSVTRLYIGQVWDQLAATDSNCPTQSARTLRRGSSWCKVWQRN